MIILTTILLFLWYMLPLVCIIGIVIGIGLAIRPPSKQDREEEYLNLAMRNMERVNGLMDDWCEDHTYLQRLCRDLGYTEDQVEGDSYGVPSIQDLAKMVYDKAQSTGKEDYQRREFDLEVITKISESISKEELETSRKWFEHFAHNWTVAKTGMEQQMGGCLYRCGLLEAKETLYPARKIEYRHNQALKPVISVPESRNEKSDQEGKQTP